MHLRVWGPQHISVQASSGGGRDGRPYLAVAVGNSLTWAYDRAALKSYVSAWREAAQANQAVRLQEFAPGSGQGAHDGEDLAVGCTVTSAQPYKVTATVGTGGRPVITVTVGAVTVAVHTTSALLSHLHAWTRAATAAGLLDTADDIG